LLNLSLSNGIQSIERIANKMYIFAGSCSKETEDEDRTFRTLLGREAAQIVGAGYDDDDSDVCI